MDYLRDGVSEISILNVAEASSVFGVFKEICQQYEMEKKGLIKGNVTNKLNRSNESLGNLTSRTLNSDKVRVTDLSSFIYHSQTYLKKLSTI